ncbi:MAG: 30S ribosomal protein S6e, partial [Candidatus Altiarchaeota archaeon]|nr:30S ribosomal protein S6e [Candidatus Altiarchaeota archaeon]
MAETQMIIGVKGGKSYKIVLDAEKMNKLRGKKIGDKIAGDVVELPGYEFEIRGGTDNNGFPMRADLPGTLKKRLLLASGVGYKTKQAGVR